MLDDIRKQSHPEHWEPEIVSVCGCAIGYCRILVEGNPNVCCGISFIDRRQAVFSLDLPERTPVVRPQLSEPAHEHAVVVPPLSVLVSFLKWILPLHRSLVEKIAQLKVKLANVNKLEQSELDQVSLKLCL